MDSRSRLAAAERWSLKNSNWARSQLRRKAQVEKPARRSAKSAKVSRTSSGPLSEHAGGPVLFSAIIDAKPAQPRRER